MATTTNTQHLFDADVFARSGRGGDSLRQVRVSYVQRLAEVDAAYAERAERDAFREGLITRYAAACAQGADEFMQLRLLAEAARYDKAHPGDSVPLADELHGTQLLADYPAVA